MPDADSPHSGPSGSTLVPCVTAEGVAAGGNGSGPACPCPFSPSSGWRGAPMQCRAYGLAPHAPLLATGDGKAVSEQEFGHLGHQALDVDRARGVVCSSGAGRAGAGWGGARWDGRTGGRGAGRGSAASDATDPCSPQQPCPDCCNAMPHICAAIPGDAVHAAAMPTWAACCMRTRRSPQPLVPLAHSCAPHLPPHPTRSPTPPPPTTHQWLAARAWHTRGPR